MHSWTEMLVRLQGRNVRMLPRQLQAEEIERIITQYLNTISDRVGARLRHAKTKNTGVETSVPSGWRDEVRPQLRNHLNQALAT